MNRERLEGVLTEKEKMLGGMPYRAFGEELSSERLAARKRVFEYNTLPPDAVEERNGILRELFGKTGREFYIEPPFRCDYGYNIEIGESFFANFNCVILDCTKVTIGSGVLFGPNVSLFTAGHPVHPELREAGLEFAAPITIGDNVWIGGHVVINPGVSIGDNTVIGAGSVVTRDIPSGVIAVGNPCRVMRPITGEDRASFLQRLESC